MKSLHAAIQSEDLDSVIQYLKQGHNPKSSYMRECFRFAVSQTGPRCTEICDSLLEYGIPFHPKHANDPKFLATVIRNGHLNCVENLLNCGAKVNQEYTIGKRKERYPPLRVAIESNQLQIVKLLLSYGGDINFKNDRGWSALHHCASSRCEMKDKMRMAKLLIYSGARVNAEKEFGISPLHVAVHNSSTSLSFVLLLLNHKANVNAVQADGSTPLHCAIKSESEDAVLIVEELLRRSANVNAAANTGFTPLHYAASLCSIQMCAVLLKHGAIIAPHAIDGTTPLALACRSNKMQTVKLLLLHGSSVDDGALPFTCNSQIMQLLLTFEFSVQSKNAALLVAASRGRLELVKMILENGAEVNCPCTYTDYAKRYGRPYDTPLHGAARNGHLQVVSYLLDHGANVNLANSALDTPLHVAAQRDQASVISTLLYHGADINLINERDNTPLEDIIEMSSYSIYDAVRPKRMQGIKAIIRQLARLRQRDVYFTHQNWEAVCEIEWLYIYYLECERELEDMEEEQIAGTGISLIDILEKNSTFVARILSNENIRRYFLNLSAKCPHPYILYWNDLTVSIQKGEQRRLFLKEASELLSFLPQICTDLILSYIGNSDIKFS